MSNNSPLAASPPRYVTADADFRIFICDHKTPERGHSSRYFSTLVTGHSSCADRAFLGDLDGPNRADEHRWSEMRQQYHVWKNTNLAVSHVGFEHYRRIFFIDFLPLQFLGTDTKQINLRKRFLKDDRDCILPLGRQDFLRYIGDRGLVCETHSAQFRNWYNSFDIVLPRPLFDLSLKRQWELSHIAPHWDVFTKVVSKCSHVYWRNDLTDLSMMRPSFFNMYIMKWYLFDEYMSFWLDCIERLRLLIPDESRILGHFSERLLNIFVFQKCMENPSLKILRVPVVFQEQS